MVVDAAPVASVIRPYYTHAQEAPLSAARVLVTLVALAVTLRAAPDSLHEHYWPQWRGPYATGVSRVANPPIEWSEAKNVRWKVEIPGRGSSSPVIWGNRVF